MVTSAILVGPTNHAGYATSKSNTVSGNTNETIKSTVSAVRKFFSFDMDSVVDKLTFCSGVGLLKYASKAPTYPQQLIFLFFALLQAKLLADRKESRKK